MRTETQLCRSFFTASFTLTEHKMSKCSAACSDQANVKTVSEADTENLRAQNRQGPAHDRTHRQDTRERPLSDSTSNANPRSHQRRWSVGCAASPIITVRKNKSEPLPPQRGVSLLRPHAASHRSSKRYSCPHPGVFSSPTHPASSSSSSSTSSCSSPPPVQTSVITGHDPLGWKLGPKSSSSSPRCRTNRLSLQIPLPVVIHEPESNPEPNSQSVNAANPDPSPKGKPPLRPKPPRRRHSDSSAFLRSLAIPRPVVTLQELCSVHLRPVTPLDESDDVFGKEEVKVTRKTPPPVPEKTSMAKQIAQLMAHSQQHCGRVESTNTRVIKPKPKHPQHTEDHSSLKAGNTGLRVDTGCDRERSNPRFPG
ncbi:serine/arginine repetitive matrix protein 1-like isoform X2 [Cottoperca gobio]|uniref:Serine/arginine repetitive matrix protein 1-like isoform X2 n=1 Tax=Cottoperca gobio TaxID=56716 RepID=A0A6J2RPZ3_COTGO|nr:serine/arginine repetitive matrix protein 1-like isoform X2 [Cottoperca gobio]